MSPTASVSDRSDVVYHDKAAILRTADVEPEAHRPHWSVIVNEAMVFSPVEDILVRHGVEDNHNLITLDSVGISSYAGDALSQHSRDLIGRWIHSRRTSGGCIRRYRK
jgi:hypothetical protein